MLEQIATVKIPPFTTSTLHSHDNRVYEIRPGWKQKKKTVWEGDRQTETNRHKDWQQKLITRTTCCSTTVDADHTGDSHIG